VDDVGGEEEVLLEGGGRGGGAVDVVEGGEGRRGPDDEAAEVAAGRELEEVEREDGRRLDAGQVAERLGDLLAVDLGVVDDQGPAALAVAAATELALTGAELAGVLDLVDVGRGADGLEEGEGGRGAGDGGALEDLGVDDERDLGDGGDLVAAGEEEGWDGRGSQGRDGCEALLAQVDLLVPLSARLSVRAPARGRVPAYLQTLVGANMRPDLHMLPKAACPARWVPPPETRGIRATARPVD
jgi:hypothetical protein